MISSKGELEEASTAFVRHLLSSRDANGLAAIEEGRAASYSAGPSAHGPPVAPLKDADEAAAAPAQPAGPALAGGSASKRVTRFVTASEGSASDEDSAAPHAPTLVGRVPQQPPVPAAAPASAQPIAAAKMAALQAALDEHARHADVRAAPPGGGRGLRAALRRVRGGGGPGGVDGGLSPPVSPRKGGRRGSGQASWFRQFRYADPGGREWRKWAVALTVSRNALASLRLEG
jgi:hypothetical protein